jgi:DNA repair protein RadC
MEAKSTITHSNIAAEVQLVYRSTVKPSERPIANSSSKAHGVLMASWDEDRIELVEQFKILLVNTGKRVLGVFEVSSGGNDYVPVDQKLIFTAALKSNANGIILAHNHPSGTLKPSAADIGLTKRLAEGGNILGIQILDHLILTTEGYYSFKDEGLL